MQKLLTSVLAFILLSGCTNIFLRPDSKDYTAAWPDRDQYVRKGQFSSTNGKNINYWLLGWKIQKPRAVILQFHGNAENMTSHAMGLGWLSEHEFHLISFDYQGYGSSEGKATIANAVSDVEAAINFASAHATQFKVPLILYGQSLGGSLMLKVLKDHPTTWSPSLIIVESSFYSYQMIAKEKLADFFLTWPLQWMAYLFISSKYDPGGKDLEKLAHMNFLLIYSLKDPIVPYHHGEMILKALTAPEKQLWSYPEPGHIAYAFVNKGIHRPKVVKAIENFIKKK